MKFRVTVCLPASSQDDPQAALAAALLPYDWNTDPLTGRPGDNPQGTWDWWHVSSHDNLVVRPEYDGDPRLVHEPTWPSGEPRPREPLRCDGGPRGLLDLAGMRAISVAEAEATWAVWERFAARHPPAEPLPVIAARYGAQPGVPSPALDRARRDHLAQPLVQALAQYAARGGDPHWPNSFLLHDPVADFGCGRREYVERLAAWAIPTYALLTLDGRWTDASGDWPFGVPVPEDGDRSGAVSADSADTDAYWRLADAYLRGLPADALMVQVLCHT